MNINTEYLPEKVYITAGFFFPFRDMLKIFFQFSDIYCLVTGLCPFLTTRLLCPWDFPGENTRTAGHFLLWGTFPTQGLNLCLLLAGRFFTSEHQVSLLPLMIAYCYFY